jgi:hypothetical protein
MLVSENDGFASESWVLGLVFDALAAVLDVGNAVFAEDPFAMESGSVYPLGYGLLEIDFGDSVHLLWVLEPTDEPADYAE